MARVVSLGDIDASLRSYLMSTLKQQDEAVVLPQSGRSLESGALKNVLLRLDGSQSNVCPELFSPNWFVGVSMVPVSNVVAENILASPEKRHSMLEKLAAALPSEMADSQLQVGPDLTADEHDRDVSPWVAGFDSPSCCAGLYSAAQRCDPNDANVGMSRAHCRYYLVCKAGAGVAGQTFHARLSTALKNGSTLNEALAEDGSPGAGDMRRVAAAARRNRGRILAIVASVLEFFTVDTIGDNASPETCAYRTVIPCTDVSYNSLRRVDTGVGDRCIWQYAAGCIDCALGQGMVVSSNVAEGFVAFSSTSGDMRVHISNDAYNCVPFSTTRISTTRDVVMECVDRHVQAARGSTNPHPDHDWLRQRFSWKSKKRSARWT